MIAPAMKTRQDEPLCYVELARQGARIERSLSGDDLPRWSQLAGADWGVRTVLNFYRGVGGLVWVEGNYEARADMLCTRCSETLDYAFTGELKLCIVSSESQATELAANCEVLVAQGDAVGLADILEDELLLAVPEQLCVSDDCERRLPQFFPATGGAPLEPAEEPQRKNPFDVLAGLKQQD
jgi:uncharacterized metal-binding protein YceD (DUF177 family)